MKRPSMWRPGLGLGSEPGDLRQQPADLGAREVGSSSVSPVSCFTLASWPAALSSRSNAEAVAQVIKVRAA